MTLQLGKLPGTFTDTVIIPDDYIEVEPRKFIRKFSVMNFREEDKFDTVTLYNIIRTRKNLLLFWILLVISKIFCKSSNVIFRLAEKLSDVGYWFERHGYK